jgi:hypothetical protein
MRANRPYRIRPIDDWLRAHPHPADRLCRARHLIGTALLIIGLAGCALGMLAALLAGAGWIGPEGLRW